MNRSAGSIRYRARQEDLAQPSMSQCDECQEEQAVIQDPGSLRVDVADGYAHMTSCAITVKPGWLRSSR